MKILTGALCYVCIIAASMATMADPQVLCVVSEGEGDSISATAGEPARTYKAVRVEAVTMRGCGPCQLLKQTTIPSLTKAGYKVKVVDRYDDNRGTTAFPTIYYFGKLGNIIRIDVGYRTYNQIIIHLEKP